MIEKMNSHYSITTPATVYDEEALTALELSARTAGKMNETVQAFNELEADTNDRLQAQDNDIDNQKKNVIPATIKSEVQNHITNGDFDEAIDQYAGNLEARLDNLIGNVVDGTSTRDSEILDARVGYDNITYANLGASIRSQIKELDLVKKQATYTKTDGVVVYTEEFNDFNNPIPNSYITYIDNINDNVLNTPPNHTGASLRVGSLLTISNRAGKDAEIGGASIQFYFDRDDAAYYRFRWSSWGKWIRLDSFNSINLTTADGTYRDPFNDLNTLPTNSYVVYPSIQKVANRPSENSGSVLTFGKIHAENASFSGTVQVYFSPNQEMYYRLHWSNRWLSWQKIVHGYEIDALKSKVDALALTSDLMEASVSLFEHVGVIGDSYASGHLYDNNNVSIGEFASVSWNQILARRNGISVVPFAKGGLTTKTWLEREYGLPKLLATEPQQLYILCLGLNDRNVGMDYLGSIEDIKTDYTTNADTFYGNYGKIIENIKAHAPNSKIIISLMARNYDDVYIAFNNAIREIAEHFNIPYITQYEDAFFQSDTYQNMNGSHPTAVAHSGMAIAMERLIAKCMVSNKTYFGEYTGE